MSGLFWILGALLVATSCACFREIVADERRARDDAAAARRWREAGRR